MLTCDLIRTSDLTDRDRNAWREMIGHTPEFRSPILSPEFVQAVATVRDDVFVAIYRRSGQTLGFLAHHRRPGGSARPVGAPFSDYTALISTPFPGITIAEALKLASIDRFQVIGLVDPYGVFGDFGGERDDAYGLDLSNDTNRVPHKHAKNVARLRRRLESQHGDVSFVMPDHDPQRFETMLQLKRTQTRATGLHDFLGAPWVDKLLRQLFTAPDTGLCGQMISLVAGDKGIVFHYGVRLGDVMHPWISSFDPDYSAFSPGQVFLMDCPKALKAAGLSYYDLSTGEQHYKNAFCNTHTVVRHGYAFGDTPAGRYGARKSAFAHDVRQAIDPRLSHLALRLGRRFDQICSLELDTKGRAQGMLAAARNLTKRLKTS